MSVQANGVNTKCRPSKLIAIPFCNIITDALGQGAHFCKFFLLLTLSKLLSEFLLDSSFTKEYYKNNCEFKEIVTK